MSEAFVTNLTYSSYSALSEGSGSISISAGAMRTSFELDDDDKSALREFASKIVDKHKRKFAEQIASMDVTPQLTYDSSKTIDNYDMPF